MFNHKMLQKLQSLLIQVADQELVSGFRQVESRDKADGSLVTDVDLNTQDRLLTELARHWPDIALLGEEMTESAQQTLLEDHTQALWLLDPLDGTSNFSSGIPFFALSIALVVQGEIEVGVIYDPVRREIFSALRGQGAWLNDQRLQTPTPDSELKRAMAIVDFKRLPASLIRALAKQAPYRSQRSFGSVALDWCWLAAGRVHIYLHGGQKLWDYAAGQLILREAGGCGDLYLDYAGTRATQISLQPRIGLAACSGALFEAWSGWIRQNR